MSLWDLWFASLALAALSVAVMLLLVLRRLVQMKFDRRRERLRAAASAALLGYLDGSRPESDVLEAAGGRGDIVADLIVEMREIMRGDSAGRLAALAAAGGGLDRERRRLRNRRAGRRAETVRRLGIYGAEAVPLLETALGDDDAGVRTAAAIELAALDASPPLATLAERMRIGVDPGSEDLRRIFRRAVAAEPRTAISLLEDEWTLDALRVLLLDGLGYAGAFAALPAIAVALGSDTSEVRIEALRALANLAHPSAAQSAIEALADPDWRVRAAAANCVRRIGATAALPALDLLLSDPQWWVRFRAAEALAAMGGDGQSRLTQAATRGDRAGQVAQLVLAERGLA